MTDQDVATKAPESDAAEGSIVPGDTKAQEGASMGVRWQCHLARRTRAKADGR